MEKRKLGNTGIEMTTLGFGCASVWGKSLITDQQATELFEQAYSLGIRYFDTGYSYGLAEGRIGKILKESSLVSREELVISTWTVKNHASSVYGKLGVHSARELTALVENPKR